MAERASDDRALAALAHGTREDRERALETLHERHKDEVHGFLARLLRDPSLADDALQETFLQLYRSFDRFEPGQPFRPWIFKIARNAALKTLRTRKKEENLATKARPKSGRNVVETTATNESRERAREALEALPDETRALLLQRHVLDMKLEDLAESFAVTERTIRNRLHAAAEAFAATFFGTRTGEPRGD